MLLRLLFLTALIMPALAAAARADDYIKPTWPDLARTMVRFNAIDLSDPAVLDEYAVVTDCELYKAFYRNDFKWHQVQQAILQSVKADIATFPTNYQYDIKLQLDRYDFAARLFRFTDKSVIHNVNTFDLYSVAGTGCGRADVKIVPRTFRAVVDAPVNMDGIPLSEKDAQGLLEQMTRDRNISRIIYARFNLRIVYVDPLRKLQQVEGESASARYQQSNTPFANWVRLDARLGSIDFYEDPQMQVLIYELQL